MNQYIYRRKKKENFWKKEEKKNNLELLNLIRTLTKIYIPPLTSGLKNIL